MAARTGTPIADIAARRSVFPWPRRQHRQRAARRHPRLGHHGRDHGAAGRRDRCRVNGVPAPAFRRRAARFRRGPARHRPAARRPHTARPPAISPGCAGSELRDPGTGRWCSRSPRDSSSRSSWCCRPTSSSPATTRPAAGSPAASQRGSRWCCAIWRAGATNSVKRFRWTRARSSAPGSPGGGHRSGLAAGRRAGTVVGPDRDRRARARDVKFVTALFFDLGVYLIVVGLVLDVLRSLGARIDVEMGQQPGAVSTA